MMALNSQYTSDLHATSYMYGLMHVCFMDSFKKKSYLYPLRYATLKFGDVCLANTSWTNHIFRYISYFGTENITIKDS